VCIDNVKFDCFYYMVLYFRPPSFLCVRGAAILTLTHRSDSESDSDEKFIFNTLTAKLCSSIVYNYSYVLLALKVNG